MHYKVNWLTSTVSTNILTMEMGRQGAPPLTVVAADEQTGGRGRLARSWFSPPGSGLYFSVLLKPAIPPADLPKITLAAAVAACRAIESVCRLRPSLKWPNDLLLNNKKFGGILAETEAVHESAAAAPLVVVGFGLNITTAPAELPPELKDMATSLLAFCGRSFSRKLILQAVVDQLQRKITLLESSGFAEIIAEWQTYDAMQGVNLAWLTPQGEIVSGKGLGVNKDGLYLVKDDAGAIHEVMSGDIKLASR